MTKRTQFLKSISNDLFSAIQANRRNAVKSTGPTSAEGKQRSRRNAVRHGLTAETVIGALEDAKDYKCFEATIIADYDAQSAVERELVLRLASVLWRLRRALTMETGLFELEAEQLLALKSSCQAEADARESLYALFSRADSANGRAVAGATGSLKTVSGYGHPPINRAADLANCFLCLSNLPSFALDRLSRYEAILWRQARQIVYALDALGRRRPQERGRFFHFPGRRSFVEPDES